MVSGNLVKLNPQHYWTDTSSRSLKLWQMCNFYKQRINNSNEGIKPQKMKYLDLFYCLSEHGFSFGL